MTPLVLLSGWGTPPQVFDPLRKSLGKLETHAFAWHGEDAATVRSAPPADPGARRRANNLRISERAAGSRGQAALTAEASSQLPGQFDLLGWSLGATVAMQLAIEAPGRVRRLVLVSATPCFVRRPGWRAGLPREDFEDFVWRLAQDPAQALHHFTGLQARGDARTREVLRALRRAVEAGGPPDPVLLRAGLDRLADTDLRTLAAVIAAPALLIHGRRDRLVSAAAASWLARRLPDARALVLPKAAHAPFLSESAAFAAALREFLETA